MLKTVKIWKWDSDLQTSLKSINNLMQVKELLWTSSSTGPHDFADQIVFKENIHCYAKMTPDCVTNDKKNNPPQKKTIKSLDFLQQSTFLLTRHQQGDLWRQSKRPKRLEKKWHLFFFLPITITIDPYNSLKLHCNLQELAHQDHGE